MESRSIAAHEREFMWLMFAAADDPSALWAAEGLRARGVKPLEWITPQMLAGARRWEHRWTLKARSLRSLWLMVDAFTVVRCRGCSIA